MQDLKRLNRVSRDEKSYSGTELHFFFRTVTQSAAKVMRETFNKFKRLMYSQVIGSEVKHSHIDTEKAHITNFKFKSAGFKDT